jgi:UDP:flavonoid glycosyltransferase YjiC (YdhE family)
MWSDDELRTLAALEADYFRAHEVSVAVTGWTLTALLSTRVAGIPLVTEHAGAFLPPAFERGLLPVPTSIALPPPIRWLPSGVRRRMYNARVSRVDFWTSGFNRVARELGVEGVPSFAALVLGDLTLVTDVPEVFGVAREDVDAWRPRRPAAYRAGTRLRYTGPIFAHFDKPIPERVERALDAGSPIVYVAITSSPSTLVRAVVAALRPLDARLIVAATAHDLRDLDGDGVTIDPVLPSHKIMPRVDLAVTAGGQGSVQTALASGTPLIGIPLQPEQDANVSLAQQQGAARLVAQHDAGTDVMTSAARELLADPTYRTNAARIARIYAASDGPAGAAEAIIDLASKSSGFTSGTRWPNSRPGFDRALV